MSRRRDILETIAARLAAIPGVVQAAPWKKNFSSEQLPAIAWRDKVEQVDIAIFGLHRYRLTVVYAGYVKGGSSTARELLLQMVTAIGADQQQGGNAQRTELVRTEIGLQVADSTISGCIAQIEIVYSAGPDMVAESFRLQDENSNNLTDENGDNLTW